MTSGIYLICNLKNGKVYVGSSVNVWQRLAWHRSVLSCGKHPNLHLQASWNHYGKDVFSFELLEEVPCGSRETDKQFNNRLVKREQARIDALDSLNGRGYNHRGAERLGELTDGARIRWLEACRKPERRERIRQGNLKRKRTSEHLVNLRTALQTPEYRAKQSVIQRSPEVIAKREASLNRRRAQGLETTFSGMAASPAQEKERRRKIGLGVRQAAVRRRKQALNNS